MALRGLQLCWKRSHFYDKYNLFETRYKTNATCYPTFEFTDGSLIYSELFDDRLTNYWMVNAPGILFLPLVLDHINIYRQSYSVLNTLERFLSTGAKLSKKTKLHDFMYMVSAFLTLHQRAKYFKKQINHTVSAHIYS